MQVTAKDLCLEHGKRCYSADDCTDFEVVVDFYSSEDPVYERGRWLIRTVIIGVSSADDFTKPESIAYF